MMTKQARFRAAFLVMALLVSVAAISAAQAQDGPQWAIVTTIDVKPEMEAEFWAIQREAKEGWKKAGVPFRHVWKTRVFGNDYEYVVVSPFPDYAVFDQPHPMGKIKSEAERAKWRQRYGKLINGQSRKALQLIGKLSIRPNAISVDAATAVVVTIQVHPGKDREFTALLRDDVLPAMKKIGKTHWLVHRTDFGGGMNEWVIVDFVKNMAAFDTPNPMVQALGPEGAAKLSDKMSGVVAAASVTLASRIAELSY